MNEIQREILESMEKQITVVGFSPIQTLTMQLGYFKGGFYQGVTEEGMKVVIKDFVSNYF